MNLQEILKSQGLTDEQIETITGEMKQNKIFTTAEENLDIRYNDLKTKYESKNKEHSEATALIEQLKKDNAGNEDLQKTISEYEAKNEALQKELEQTKVNSALKVALLKANVTDVDYLTFKVKEKGEVMLDDNGNIKGIDDTIAALKTQYPQHFASKTNKKIEENRLPDGNDDRDNGEPETLADALKAKYENED